MAKLAVMEVPIKFITSTEQIFVLVVGRYDASVCPGCRDTKESVGQRIPFFYPDPRSESTAEARKASIRALNETIQVAKNVVVAGGGAVGTEVAADIKLRHPSTS